MNRLPLALLAALALTVPAWPGWSAEAAVLAPTFATYVAPSGFFAEDLAAEPSLGIAWRTDALMFQSYVDTYRVTFDDAVSPPAATWTDVSSPYSLINIDPIAATDHGTGRTWAGGLDGACSVLSFTDNDGASWTPVANSCAGAAIDHPTIGSGPWSGTAPLDAVYPSAVYYCAQLSVAQCSVSMDGGISFRPGVAIQCGFVNPGLHGSVHVGPNGYAYLPFQTCGAENGVAVTTNNGVTWTSRPIPGATAPSIGFDPDVATTPSGWAWVAYPTSAFGVGVALTKNGGANWQNFGDVAAAAGVRSATFHEMVAGDDGRAAAVYLGSTTDGNPHDGRFAGVWHVYVTYTMDAGATWSTVRASDNVIQRGWICADGTGCSGGRNLLDFIDAQVDSKGRIAIALADGCIGSCETGSGRSDANYAMIVRQSGGSTLFAAHDPSGPSAPAAPTLTGTAGDGQNGLTWTTPADNGAAITGYKVYRNGALLATVGNVNAYTDTAVANGASYAYQVAAVNSVGEGAKSNTVSLTPLAQTAPSAPQNLQASHSGGPKSGKVALSWSAPASDGNSPITGYKVYRNGALAATLGVVLSYTDSGLAQGQTYAYKVTAVNAKGESAFSNEATAIG